MKEPKMVNTLWNAVGYSFVCGLSLGDAVIMLNAKKFWLMGFYIGLMIFTGWLADSCFRDVKKVLEEKVEESKNESRNES
jgi:hypothetical protein